MAVFHKCPICGQLITDLSQEVGPVKITADGQVTGGNRYAHRGCYQAYIKGISDKKTKESKERAPRGRRPKAETKTVEEPLSEEEFRDKKALFAYLRDALDVEPNPKIYALVGRYIAQYGMSYKGMLDCLTYLNEVVKKPLEGDVVGIIPYYYDEAKKWYEDVKKVESSNRDANPQYKERVIKIQRPVNKRKKEIEF